MLAAVLGSIITLGAYKALNFDNGNEKTIKTETTTPTVLTNNMPNVLKPEGKVPASVDFTQASAHAMPAVVHIKASKNVTAQQHPFGGGSRSFDPFDFFNDDFFGPFFHSPTPQNPQPQVGSGSGVIIDKSGYIVTNNHVVDGADELEVALYDNRSYPATIIGVDPSTDLALIKIEENNLPILNYTNSDHAKVGEWVLAVGNPFNLSSTVTAGIISAKGRNINILKSKRPIESFIQTDAAVNPGNSGGALVNVRGELLGINTAIATPTGTYAGYSFAVPANIVKKVVADLMEYGVVQRAFLGIMIRDLNGELARDLGLDISQGVYVDSLLRDGSAYDSGLDVGDVIVKVDDIAVKSSPELQEQIGRHRPGDKVKVTINRKGKERDIYVTLKNRVGNTNIVTDDDNSMILKALGVELEDLSPSEAQRYRLRGGVRVSKLKNGLLKKQTGIREGFIIFKIDGQAIKSVADMNKILANKEGGVLIEGIYPGDPTSYFYGFGM